MSRITRTRGALSFDDRIDVLSMAVGFWVDIMAQDVNTKMDNRKEELLDAELERFMEFAVGKKQKRGERWI